MPTALPNDSDLNTVTTPGLYYADLVVVANKADSANAFSLFVESTGAWGNQGRKQTYTAYDTGETYIRVITGNVGDVWTDWEKIATATPPQEYDLPLVEGVESYGISKYCKTQENIVIVNFAVVFADVKTGSGSYLFATLPAGFRPNGVIVTSASAWCESPLGRNAVECDVRQDGGIYISTTEQSIQYVHGQVVFVAA